MDLVASFVHDTEQALASGLKVSMVTLDVQGAFDALLKRRLLQRMRRQGWPLRVLRLADSFLTDRHVRVRLESATTDYERVRCGTPQGSPWSPVLYMLYLAELLQQDPKLRFGYADDICLYRTSNTLEQNARLLAGDVKKVLDWGNANRVAFAPEKCELLHITRSRSNDNPPVTVTDDFVIHPVREPEGSDRTPALRWLGVWFDRRLTFKRHIAERVGKATQVAQHIRGLASTKYGPPASGLRKAVITCVIPTALYGTEAWYGGRTKPARNLSQAGKAAVSARVGNHIAEIQRAFTLAAKATIPVWRTTPTDTLYRDTGLPTAQIAVDQALWRFSYRLRTVDRGHPLAKRTELKPITRGRGAGGAQRPKTKVQTVARMLPPVQRPVLVPPRYPPGSREDPTLGMTKEEAAGAFRTWYSNLPATDVVVFTDGSQEGTDVGYGYAIYQGGRLLMTGRGRLDPCSIVFDAEVTGAWKGLQAAVSAPPDLSRRRIWVCLDNTGAIWGLRANAAPSSQWAYLKFHAATDTHDVRVKWCPGHCDIEGNELADKLAKAGSKLREVDRDCTPTAYGIKSTARKAAKISRSQWWEAAQARLSPRYRRWKLRYRLRCPAALAALTRPALHHYLAIRTGHGDFAWYHRKFRHDDAKLHCSCGREKDPEYLVRCRKAQASFDLWPHRPTRRPNTRDEQIRYLSELMKDPISFQEFLNVTAFYNTIYAR
ncbi:hypothetical protein DL768_007978 [Monosporascus sp. mg162]|nr:hypothetical protein DL768_007978 [Monosporascus sp. mg162]